MIRLFPRYFSYVMRSPVLLTIIGFASIWAGPATQALGQKIIDMKVRGNQKVESEAILTILGTQKGKDLDRDKVHADITELYELGYFSDIRFFKEDVAGGIVVTVEVKEKPSIIAIEFQGLDELGEDDFKEKLLSQLYTIVNEATITTDLRMIEKQYLEKGFFLAQARYELDPSPNNPHEITLKFIVDEGGKVMVGDVFIEGNEYFSDADLIANFFSKPLTRGSTFAQPGSVYNDEFLQRDLEVTSFLYKDQGFAEVKVSNANVIMDKDRRFVRVTFGVEEGIQYSIGSIEFSGDILYPEEQLREWMQLKDGDLFRFSLFRKDIEKLVDKYGDKGYAFVDVNPIPRFDREKKLVHLNYAIDKGQKVYFGDLLIEGNVKTRDNVIRREFEVADSELYSGTRLALSKRNIERLGYFEEVQSIKKRDDKDPSVINYTFKVKEKPTGQLQAALGFSPGAESSSESSWFGQGRYNEENQSGTGIKTNVTGRWNGGNNYSLELGVSNPRVNDSDWSLGGRTFWRNSVRYISNDLDIQERRVGGSVTLGRRLFELVRGSIGYRYAKISQQSRIFLLERFKEDGVASTLILGLSRDNTNNYIDPSDGMRSRITQSFTGGPMLGGNRQFMETRVSNAVYLPVDFTDTYRTYFRINSVLGLLYPYGDKAIPFYDRYRQGGPDDMRGFRYNTLGPYFNIVQAPGDDIRLVNTGGTKELLFQFEYFFPLIQDANIKGILFTDWGRVYDDNESLALKGFYRDVGFGFRWITPIAPFRFEWAYPIVNGEIGDLEFIFSLGF